jgi:hypothetical protein
MKKIEAPPTITVGDKEYPVSGFSDTVKQLIDIHTLWRNDLQDLQLQVSKTQAALRALDAELNTAVQKELKPAPAPINTSKDAPMSVAEASESRAE